MEAVEEARIREWRLEHRADHPVADQQGSRGGENGTLWEDGDTSRPSHRHGDQAVPS